MTDRTLEAIDQKQREEKPLKLALVENARLCRELERQLRQKDVEMKKQEKMANLGEAAMKGANEQWCNLQTWGKCAIFNGKLGADNCKWQDFCKLRKEMGK